MISKLFRLPKSASGQARSGKFGFGWAAASQLVGLVVKLGSTLILTRLLSPEVYGVIGTAMVVLTTLEWLADLGVVPALLRKPRGGDREWLLVGWWIGLGRGMGLSVACLAMAAPLALWYGKAEMFGVLALLALRPALMALRSPGMPELRRLLEGRKLFVDELMQTVGGTAVAIAYATFVPHAGPGAIVAGTLAGALIGVMVSYWLCPFRPVWYWDKAIAAELIGVGRQILVNTLLMSIWLNLDRLLGPSLMSIEILGLYAVAWNIAAAAEAFMTRGIEVYFSLLIRQHEGAAREEWHQRTAGRIVMFVVPMFAMGVLIAGPFIRTVYDPRYHAAGVILAILLARLAVRLAGQLDFQLLLAGGDLSAATIGYAVGAAIQLVAVPLLARWGGIGLSAAVLISTIAITAVQIARSAKLRTTAWKRTAFAVAVSSVAIALAIIMG
ncbi:MAG: oligosaccharide flippase family protein [Gemmataceae bacterium]